MGRPPLPLGTYGKVPFLAQPSGQVKARAKFRDYDGRVRLVSKVGPSRAAAERALKAEFTSRQAPGGVGAITAATRMATLAEAWIEADHGWSIAREATRRGHQVTSYSRSLPEQPTDGVTYVVGSVLDDSVRGQALHEADVVVVAFAPRGDMTDQMRPAAAALAADAGKAGVRLGVVGGAGSLLTVEGGARLVDVLTCPRR